ncbi:MAG TPA: diguanylate cyclase [Trueperaceae bacterium]
MSLATAAIGLVLLLAALFLEIPLLWLAAVLIAGTLLYDRAKTAERRARESNRRTALLTEAAAALQKVDTGEALFRTALRMLADVLDYSHANVFAPRDDTIVMLASHRLEVPAGFTLPHRSIVGEALGSREVVYAPDVRRHASYFKGPNTPNTLSELAIPLLMEERVAAVLNIEHTSLDAFSPELRSTLLAFGNMIEEALERVSLHSQLVKMLEIIRKLAQSEDPARLFEDTVKAAIDLIPGAEAGTLGLYENDGFKFAAAVGYDPYALKKITGVDEDTQLSWYAGPREDFLKGVPRLLTGEEVMRASLAGLDTEEQRRTLIESGRLAELTANIAVPISYGGKVMAMLNIDSFAPVNPFGPHALLLAESFAQQIAVIIRQTLYRDALEQAVVTDALTGLGNREGFNRQLNVELARARRYGQNFNLVMIDLDGFKRINDKVGHQAGDRVLVQVGEAIERERREGDSVFRWGGDEFALILPQISREDAWMVAERYVAAISRVRMGDYGLSASFGIASYPEDGTDAETLLRKADDLMYEHKAI